MNKGFHLSAITAALVACNVDPKDSGSRSAPVRYHNAQYDFTFSLSQSWRGYSVSTQQWEGQTYLSAVDKVVTAEQGPVIVLRHPQWKSSDLHQDIPTMVFTRSQWEAHRQGRFSAVGAGGVLYEIGHNSRYVFAIHSRYNADDSVKGWKEAADVVGRNQAANAPLLYSP